MTDSECLAFGLINLATLIGSRGQSGRRSHLLLLEGVVIVSREVPSFVSAIRASHYVVGVQDALTLR